MDTETIHQPVKTAESDIPGRTAADEALAGLTKALGHPVRAGIVRLLAGQDMCMYGDLSDRLPLAKSTVSEHLRILRQAGLVRVETDGQRVCYCIDAAGLARLKDLVEGL